jgi:hypothetical protein
MPPGKLFARLLCGTVAAGALAGCGSSEDVRPAQWSFIAPAIIEPGCATANCHSSLAQRASVDLSTRAIGYRTLITRHFVIPNASATSELLYLLTAQGTNRMPPDFPLPAADIQLITSWIDAGANDD